MLDIAATIIQVKEIEESLTGSCQKNSLHTFMDDLEKFN